jgi:hypothetical protein
VVTASHAARHRRPGAQPMPPPMAAPALIF